MSHEVCPTGIRSDYTHLLFCAKTCIAWRPGELTQFFVNHRQELLSGVAGGGSVQTIRLSSEPRAIAG